MLGDGVENHRSRPDCATDRPADFACADTFSIGDGNLLPAQASADRLDLHFDRSAKVIVDHGQVAQLVVGNYPKRAEVGVTCSEQHPH